jgi:hypothetical protein
VVCGNGKFTAERINYMVNRLVVLTIEQLLDVDFSAAGLFKKSLYSIEEMAVSYDGLHGFRALHLL